MNYNIPKNSRLTARVILLDDKNRVLYLKAAEPDTQAYFWVMPGGGLKQNESFEAAAIREAYEETGLSIRLGPFVWIRRHQFTWKEQFYDQYEHYFVAWTSNTKVHGLEPDEYIVGYRWWTLSEIETSNNKFAPRKIKSLLPSILCGKFPEKPFNCGV